ncbi:MAG TPA: sulfur transferase domain-containing protein [Vicinamibacterales bacterium]|nr:sulfur transferase domain-containing protein [Vicinamibacterales bacterium]
MSASLSVLATLAALSVGAAAFAQQVTEKSVAGVTNFKALETTIACAGATTAAAVPELKKMGYASIINLRQASENGANIEEETAAAKAAGITFIHLPLNTQAPDPAVAEQFLAAVTKKENQPAFIHCASGNRAAAMWLIKRMVVDHWDADKASTEAASLGLTNQALKKFATDYADAHKH